MASILIINELVGHRELLELVMEQLGYTSFQAADGITALQIIKKNNLDLVIVDLKIRRMNARQILHQICSIRHFKK